MGTFRWVIYNSYRDKGDRTMGEYGCSHYYLDFEITRTSYDTQSSLIHHYQGDVGLSQSCLQSRKLDTKVSVGIGDCTIQSR